MTAIEIIVASTALAIAILAMLADRARTIHKRDLGRHKARADHYGKLSDQYRDRWKDAVNEWKQAEAQYAAADRDRISARRLLVAALDTIFDAGRDAGAAGVAAEKRAALHCRMIEDQRRRGDSIWARLMAVGRQLVRAENALTGANENRALWSACPACGRLVECRGPSPIGECRHCACTFTDSDICVVDPVRRESGLIDTAYALYRAGRELHASLTSGPAAAAAPAVKRIARFLDAAEKAWPDIINPPAGPGRPLKRADPDAAQYAATITGDIDVGGGPTANSERLAATKPKGQDGPTPNSQYPTPNIQGKERP